jgi:hypothetical protein
VPLHLSAGKRALESEAKSSVETRRTLSYSVVVVQSEVEVCVGIIVFSVAMLAKEKSALLLVLCGPIFILIKYKKNRQDYHLHAEEALIPASARYKR